MNRFAALLLIAISLGACVLDDDPAVTAALREDARCRDLGVVPQSQLYVDCRRALFNDRSRVFDENLRAEKAKAAAKAAVP